MSNAFTTLESACIPFFKDDIDTDQIIPARFLTGTTKAGLGEKMFHDWRYHESGERLPESIFDAPAYAGREILVAGNNFGCGSSREHAPWALKDYGIRAIIAISFADIFYNNALKNAVLPIALPENVVSTLIQTIQSGLDSVVSVDLANQTVDLPGQGRFTVNLPCPGKSTV